MTASNSDNQASGAGKPKKRVTDWVRERIWVLFAAVAFGLAGAAIDRFGDEIRVWVRSFFFEGNTGTYTLKSWTYPDHSTVLSPFSETVELKDDGRTVFGTIKDDESGAEYKLFGYHRTKYLVISYGGKGPLGGGTLALQTDIAEGVTSIFWGWQTSIECVGPESWFVQCPALMYKRGTSNPQETYANFFKKDHCARITRNGPPELCDQLTNPK